MARTCDICHRGTQTGVSRSHSNIATKKRKLINLQKRFVNGRRISVCASCLKTLIKQQT